jgi:hypothetical protein
VTYTKRGPFVDASPTGPYVDAGFFNTLEAALVTVSGPLAPAPNGSDDTAALNAWLAGLATGTGYLAAGTYQISGTVTIPSSVTVIGYRSKIRGLTGSFDMIALSSGSGILGVEVDGNSAVRTGGSGIFVNNAAGVRVADCYLHDMPSAAIRLQGATTTGWVVQGNRILNCTGVGIYTAASQGRILGNHIDTAQHGIQWYGGDANGASPVISVFHLVIAGNMVRNVTGGIWGALGQFITVADNDIDTCADVGIDFEGCKDCTATGGTVHNAKNACLSTFYASQRITFSGITCFNDTNNTAGGDGAGFKAYSPKTSTDITVEGCSMTTVAGAIQTDSNALASSVFHGCKITVTQSSASSTSLKAFRILDGTLVDILDNRITCHTPTGISFEGPSDSTIAGNRITTDQDTTAPTSGAPSATGGILLYARSSTYPGKRNRVKNNTVAGFVQSINDNFGTTADAGTLNLIEANIATTINRTAGASYTGVISNNRKNADLTASTLTTF